MISRVYLLAALLLLAPAIAAETIYKYRRADGRMIYSNRPMPGVELIEAFEYKFDKPTAARVDASKSDAAGEARIKAHLAALEKAWSAVQEAHKALATAQERLRAGVEPQEGEGRALAGPATPAAPATGGPQGPAAPAAGGPAKAAPPAVGGPLGTRRGGGMQPEYRARMEALQAEVQAARARLDSALRRYNELR